MRSAVEERGRVWRKTSRSRQVGTIFSMPTTEMRVSGRVRHIRPLPSDSTTTRVPVSATMKLAPEMPTLARRNFSRRWRRAASASSAGVSLRPSGAGRPQLAHLLAEDVADLAAVACGWRGRGCGRGGRRPSCTMSSARSVSYGGDAGFFEGFVEADLLGGHGLDLDHLALAGGLDQARSTMRLASSASDGPVDDAARRGDGLLQLHQVGSRWRRVWSLTASPASRRGPVGEFGDRAGPLGRGWCGWRGAGWRAAVVSRSASRAALGKAGMPRTCRSSDRVRS